MDGSTTRELAEKIRLIGLNCPRLLGERKLASVFVTAHTGSSLAATVRKDRFGERRRTVRYLRHVTVDGSVQPALWTYLDESPDPTTSVAVTGGVAPARTRLLDGEFSVHGPPRIPAPS